MHERGYAQKRGPRRERTVPIFPRAQRGRVLQRNLPHALFRAFGPVTGADVFAGVAQAEQVFRVQKASDLRRSGYVSFRTRQEREARTMCSTSVGRSHSPRRRVESVPGSEDAFAFPDVCSDEA